MKEAKSVNVNICRYLKGKNTFGTLEGGDLDWHVIDDPNTSYWCVKSLGAGGPDNGPVGTRMCRPGRSCYKPRD